MGSLTYTFAFSNASCSIHPRVPDPAEDARRIAQSACHAIQRNAARAAAAAEFPLCSQDARHVVGLFTRVCVWRSVDPHRPNWSRPRDVLAYLAIKLKSCWSNRARSCAMPIQCCPNPAFTSTRLCSTSRQQQKQAGWCGASQNLCCMLNALPTSGVSTVVMPTPKARPGATALPMTMTGHNRGADTLVMQRQSLRIICQQIEVGTTREHVGSWPTICQWRDTTAVTILAATLMAHDERTPCNNFANIAPSATAIHMEGRASVVPRRVLEDVLYSEREWDTRLLRWGAESLHAGTESSKSTKLGKTLGKGRVGAQRGVCSRSKVPETSSCSTDWRQWRGRVVEQVGALSGRVKARRCWNTAAGKGKPNIANEKSLRPKTA